MSSTRAFPEQVAGRSLTAIAEDDRIKLRGLLIGNGRIDDGSRVSRGKRRGVHSAL